MIAAILVLGVIILFHEFGHFLLARINGVAVVEFSLGFGPRLFSWVSKKSGTRYSVKLLPLGGSCAMMGEWDEEEIPAGEEKPEGTSFFTKSPLARMSIIAAGPIFNFIMAFLFAVVILAWAGIDRPVLVGVMEGYGAEEAGLMAGDVITEFNGRKIAFSRDISYDRDMALLSADEVRPVPVSYKRFSEETGRWVEKDTVLTPEYSEEDGAYYLGLKWSPYRTAAQGPLELLQYGFYEVRTQIRMAVDSLKLLVAGKVGADGVAGPVRIVSMIGDSVEVNKQFGFVTVLMNLLNITVMFSANLGVLNLLPIPALDGGRLLFLLWELIAGKPLNARVENAVNMTGMALLMTFMVLVLFNDIRFLVWK